MSTHDPGFNTMQPRLPLSGLVYMARLTGRPLGVRRWLERRILEMKVEHWAPKSICRLLAKELEAEKWNDEDPSTQEGD